MRSFMHHQLKKCISGIKSLILQILLTRKKVNALQVMSTQITTTILYYLTFTTHNCLVSGLHTRNGSFRKINHWPHF